MPRAKKQPNRCKVIDERTGKRCRNKAIDNSGMCKRHKKLHKQTGPKTVEGAERAAAALPGKFGVYSMVLSEEETELIPELQQMKLEQELGMMRLRYRRLLQMERQILSGDPPQHMVSRHTTQGVIFDENNQPKRTGAGSVTQEVRAMTLTDCHKLMSQTEGRIMHCERQIAELAQLPQDDNVDMKTEILQFVRHGSSISGGELGEQAFEPDPEGLQGLQDAEHK